MGAGRVPSRVPALLDDVEASPQRLGEGEGEQRHVVDGALGMGRLAKGDHPGLEGREDDVRGGGARGRTEDAEAEPRDLDAVREARGPIAKDMSMKRILRDNCGHYIIIHPYG